MASRIFVLSSPGFFFLFFVAPRWAPRPFGGARAKTQKPPPRVFFFFAPAPAKGRGRRSPVGRRNGARAKKNTRVCCFFALAPAKGRGRRSPVGRRHGARAKKKRTLGVVFLLWPWAGAQRGFSFLCLSPGPEPKKKNTLGGVFCVFALAPPKGRGAQRGATTKILCTPGDDSKTKNLETNDTGHEQKGATTKKTDRSARTVVVFFFAVAPPGRSLTQCGLGRFRQGPGGVCFFFLAAAPPNPASQ